MKTFSNAMLGSLMVVVSVLPCLQARAQSDVEPAIVVCMAPLAEQMNDIGYIADSSGFGQMSFLIKLQLEQYLKGIDTKNPSGVLMYFEEGREEPKALGFLPMSSTEDFLDTISQYAKVEEGKEFTTITPEIGPEVLMKEVDGFAYFSDREEMFESIPNDPIGLVGEMPEKFNFGAKIYAQRIPEAMRKMWLDTIEESYNETMGELGGIPSEMQEKNFEMQMETMRSLINETEQLIVGLAADRETESIYVDVEMTGLDGSKMATDAANQKGTKPSRFSGLLMEGAAFTANMCTEMSESDSEQQLNMVASLREEVLKEMNDSDLSDKELEMGESIADDVFEVIEDTIREGRMDGGLVIVGDEQLEFAMGMHVSDPAKLEGAIKDLLKIAEEDGEVADVIEINLNSGTLKGLQLHEIVVRIEEGEPEMRELFGDELTLLLGIGNKEVFLVGSSDDPAALLEKVMKPNDDAEADNMMQYNLHLASVFKMAASIDGDEMSEKMADMLTESGRDRVRVDAKWIENGLKGRLEIQDGVLGLIGIAAQNMGGMLDRGAEF